MSLVANRHVPIPQPSPLFSVHEHPENSADLKGQDSSTRSFWVLTGFERDVLVASTLLKLLLFPSYKSTDFEVHRNWLAITNSLPLSQWYYDITSDWTLDYPPFFAYFECLLSIPASIIDPAIVDLFNLNYSSWTVVAYQRSTVLLTELVLGAALLRFSRSSTDSSTQGIISASLFMHPGFVIVDHIHFQYNGFMFGILMWSLLMARDGSKLKCGILFAILLNFKHIYMYIAPAYFVYLLRGYCMTPQVAQLLGTFIFPNFLSLGNAVIITFAVSLAPFALRGQLQQLFARLFPFTRGLNHAYWAPNAWSLVTALDRILLLYVKRSKASGDIQFEGLTSTSRGLVGDTVFAVLPAVKPIHTFVITILLQLIFLTKLWRLPTFKSFLTALTLSGYVSFLFGWHVHEKAVLLILVPLSLIAVENQAYFRTFVIASVAGIVGLFPLIFTPAESIFKLIYSCLWMAFVFRPLSRRIYEFPKDPLSVIIDLIEKLYLRGFIVLQVAVAAMSLIISKGLSTGADLTIGLCGNGENVLPCAEPIQKQPAFASYEFLPLMLTSVYCAVGLCWAFIRLSILYLMS